jgi:hypothetical protein
MSTPPPASWASIAAAPPTPAKPRLTVVLAPPTPAEKDFKEFTFFVRSAATEFLNNVKQGSYKILDDAWWKAAHDGILKMVDEHQYNNYGISSRFIDSLLAKLPAGLLDEKLKGDFIEYIVQAYIRYNAGVKETCYCDDALCGGDCGVHACGCIDTCRCWQYDDMY